MSITKRALPLHLKVFIKAPSFARTLSIDVDESDRIAELVYRVVGQSKLFEANEYELFSTDDGLTYLNENDMGLSLCFGQSPFYLLLPKPLVPITFYYRLERHIVYCDENCPLMDSAEQILSSFHLDHFHGHFLFFNPELKQVVSLYSIQSSRALIIKDLGQLPTIFNGFAVSRSNMLTSISHISSTQFFSLAMSPLLFNIFTALNDKNDPFNPIELSEERLFTLISVLSRTDPDLSEFSARELQALLLQLFAYLPNGLLTDDFHRILQDYSSRNEIEKFCILTSAVAIIPIMYQTLLVRLTHYLIRFITTADRKPVIIILGLILFGKDELSPEELEISSYLLTFSPWICSNDIPDGWAILQSNSGKIVLELHTSTEKIYFTKDGQFRPSKPLHEFFIPSVFKCLDILHQKKFTSSDEEALFSELNRKREALSSILRIGEMFTKGTLFRAL